MGFSGRIGLGWGRGRIAMNMFCGGYHEVERCRGGGCVSGDVTMFIGETHGALCSF